MRAMIFAAGLGTRLKPLTESIPKALIKIKNHTLLELQINKLKLAGFDYIIINVHHFADLIKDYLKQNNFLKLIFDNISTLQTKNGFPSEKK